MTQMRYKPGPIRVFEKKTGNYLGARQIRSGIDKQTGGIYYFIIWRGKEVRFHPNVAEPIEMSEVVYV